MIGQRLPRPGPGSPKTQQAEVSFNHRALLGTCYQPHHGRGFRGLGCFRFHARLVVLHVLPGVGAGSEAEVTIVFLCGDLLGSGTASPTVGAKQAAV